MKTPHKHAALIKAWADGAEIQYHHRGMWFDSGDHYPVWAEDVEYRIKPEPLEIIQAYRVNGVSELRAVLRTNADLGAPNSTRVKWTIDPETNKILKVELVE